MKKIILALVVVVGVLASCSKKDDNQITTKSLIGTWYVTKVLLDNKEGTLDECEMQNYITFSDTNLKEFFYSKREGNCDEKIINNLYSITENKIVVIKENTKEERTFSLQGTILKIHYTTIGGSIVTTILEKR